eukprot:1159872-Pelagomonas_calceolata.AAC.6
MNRCARVKCSPSMHELNPCSQQQNSKKSGHQHSTHMSRGTSAGPALGHKCLSQQETQQHLEEKKKRGPSEARKTDVSILPQQHWAGSNCGIGQVAAFVAETSFQYWKAGKGGSLSASTIFSLLKMGKKRENE